MSNDLKSLNFSRSTAGMPAVIRYGASLISSKRLKEEPMRKLFTVLLCMTLAAAPLALAQDKAKAKAPTEAQKKQQERMKSCNDKAGDRKGEDRKKFMSGCLKGQDAGPSAAQKAQQDRMKDCNKQANLKNMKGEDRKKFMSSCLSG
ncbi:MAG TPA: PsiF family protein [Burkholderiales bacterium]|nr:PsiF family protein [Burkholderiales bacterium]